jgi:hypothetical protein
MKVALFGVVVAADPVQQAFFQFVKDFKKQYPIEEIFDRFNIFKANLALVEEHNAENNGWEMGINQFADLTKDEFRSYLGLRPRENSYLRSKNTAPVPNVPANDIDWTQKGAVTPVKDQGQCGSCWAFSTTGAVEGAVAVKTGQLTSVSEQELVDCAGSSGNQGCNGGLMDDAFEWIIKNQGIASEAAYPYHARDGQCQKQPIVSKISAYTDAPKTESALGQLLQQQPISIAIEADQSSFQMYKSGVFNGPCGTSLDHGVLLVGMGTDPTGGDYWKVKNSWGTTWGDQGYIRWARNKNMCGMANMASYPTA